MRFRSSPGRARRHGSVDTGISAIVVALELFEGSIGGIFFSWRGGDSQSDAERERYINGKVGTNDAMTIQLFTFAIHVCSRVWSLI